MSTVVPSQEPNSHDNSKTLPCPALLSAINSPRLSLQEQYLEVTTSVASTSRLFGLGERTQSAGAELRRDGVPLALWAADRGSLFADVNLYGSWPFLLQLAPGGQEARDV